jgi:hypothetical protein
VGEINMVELTLTEQMTAEFRRTASERGLEARISCEVLQERYLELVRKGGRGDIAKLKKLQAVTGVPFSEDKIQQLYKLYMINNQIGHICILQNITGVKPNLPPELVYKGYEAKAEEGRVDLLKNLKQATGIEIPEHIAQRAYQVIIEHGWCERLGELREVTGVKPNIPEEVVQNGYQYCVRALWVEELSRLEEFTGIPPNIPVEVVQKAYERAVLEKCYTSFTILKRFTRVEPVLSEETVQKGYETCFNLRGTAAELRKLYEISGIKPRTVPTREIQQRYRGIMISENCGLDELLELQEFTGVKPDQEVFDRIVSEYLQ